MSSKDETLEKESVSIEEWVDVWGETVRPGFWTQFRHT